MIRKILGFTAVVGSFLSCSFAQAQDVPMAGKEWDVFASIYVVIGGAVLVGVGWLINWGASKLTGSYVKEVAAKFLGMFDVGLQGGHAKYKLELEAARDPNSPSGVSITKKELDSIHAHMWEYLKTTYGSVETITKIVGILTGTKGTAAAKAFIDNKIDAGVAELENRGPA